MAEDKAQTEAQISELISTKLSAEDVTAEWVVASTMMLALPVLKDIAKHLNAISVKIAHDEAQHTIEDELRWIMNTLEKLLNSKLPKKGN
jgi:hypothetical protein